MESSRRSLSDTQPPSKKLRVATSTTIYREQDDTTVDVDLHEVPEFLRCGDYYRSFRDGETKEPCTGDGDSKDPISNKRDGQTKDVAGHNSSINVPSNCYKNSPMITNSSDLHHLLSTLRFWLVDVLPDSVIAYALNNDTGRSFFAVAEPFMNDMPKLKVLETIHLKLDRSDRLIVAMEETSCVEIVEYLFENCKDESPLSERVASTAIKLGNAKYLQYAYEQGCPWTTTTCSNAAAKGHLNCLKYAHEHGCPWDAYTNIKAAEVGHLDCMMYAHEHGCPFDCPPVGMGGSNESTLSAAIYGHLNCLQYAHQHGASLHPEAAYDALGASALGGHIDCVQYALQNGFSLDNRAFTMSWAVLSRNLDCVVYLRDQGCPLNEVALQHAAEAGYLHIVMYLHREGCPWGVFVCKSAAVGGYLDCLQYLHEQGCPWDEQTTLAAATFGHASCLEYAITQGCPVQQDICYWMFDENPFIGRLHCLLHLLDLGYQVDEETIEAARAVHDTSCVEYLTSMENQVQPS